MADTIYLIRGQDLDVTATFRDEAGDLITIDGTYTVTSSMKSLTGCKTAFALSPTVSGGSVLIHRATDDLTDPRYVFDIIAKPSSGSREITTRIYLQLEQPITPLT
jgi:hypothetical protein